MLSFLQQVRNANKGVEVTDDPFEIGYWAYIGDVPLPRNASEEMREGFARAVEVREDGRRLVEWLLEKTGER